MSNNRNENKEVLLPTRDFLRQIFGQPKIGNIDIKNILRSRGVFTLSNAKEVTSFILIKTGLSPAEFDELKENFKTKEESEKSKTRTIKWKSDKNLIDCIPDDINYSNVFNDKFGTFTITKLSNFTTVHDNPNHMLLDFEIERQDPVRNLGENSIRRTGRIEIKKNSQTNLLTISLTHTTPETMDFGNKVSYAIIKNFKDNDYIDKDEDIVAIKFSDFTNESRILFLKDLSQNVKYTNLKFKDTKDIHFSPDETMDDLPGNIEWMQKKINDMKIKGKELHSTFFMGDKSIHPFIKIFSIQCDYDITNEELGISGSCRLLFEFSNPSKNSSDDELILNLAAITLDTNNSTMSKNQISKFIVESLEQYKLEIYEKYKKP